MPDEKALIRLTLEGAPVHRGHPMAHALNEKWGKFLRVFANFERAHTGKRVRQTDFEIISLSHNSPAEIAMNPVPRVANYIPDENANWTFAQWGKIARGERPDDLIDDAMIDDFADLSQPAENQTLGDFSVRYRDHEIDLNEKAESNARQLAATVRAVAKPFTWMSGASLGALNGELRSVLDEHGERQFVIVPPVGPLSVTCVFPEHLREKIRQNLFKFAKVYGVLRYGPTSPFPYLIEMSDIEPLDGANDERDHLISGHGLFRDSVYEHEPNDWA